MSVRPSVENNDGASPNSPIGRTKESQNQRPSAPDGNRGPASRGERRAVSIIDADTMITGTVTCTGEMELRGQVEGQIHSRNLIIRQHGHMHGDIFCESVMVDGRVDGNLHANQVDLKSSANVNGDIHHTFLTIETGAMFEGDVRRSNNPTQVQQAEPRNDAQADAQLAAPQMEPAMESLRDTLMEPSTGGMTDASTDPMRQTPSSADDPQPQYQPAQTRPASEPQAQMSPRGQQHEPAPAPMPYHEPLTR